MMVVAEQDFKIAMAAWASGVSVVTAVADGQMQGMAVSSFSSVSLSARLISVCLSEGARTLRSVIASEAFAVNVLSSAQDEVSKRFAARIGEAERFPAGSYELGPCRCPLLHGAIAQLECQLFAAHPAGDHRVVIGEVRFARTTSGEPLLYYSRRYGGFAPHAVNQ